MKKKNEGDSDLSDDEEVKKTTEVETPNEKDSGSEKDESEAFRPIACFTRSKTKQNSGSEDVESLVSKVEELNLEEEDASSKKGKKKPPKNTPKFIRQAVEEPIDQPDDEEESNNVQLEVAPGESFIYIVCVVLYCSYFNWL